MDVSQLKSLLEKEGFPIIYEWEDKPNTKYLEHFHKGKVSFYVLKGSVTFYGGINQVVSAGERIDVPIGIKHSAIVGSDGCKYLVGQEIKGDA